MSKHNLIVESWRDFLRAQFRREPNPSNITFDSNYDPFVKKHDYFYYKEPYFTGSGRYNKPKGVITLDEMAQMIDQHRLGEEFLVRPNTMSVTGEYYSWKKFKYLNQKVEAIRKEREEAEKAKQRAAEEARRARFEKFRSGERTTDSELALAVITKDELDTLVLYHRLQLERDGMPMVIGMISLGDMHGPCIPETLQVRFVGVAIRFQKSGYGTILYRLAAAHSKVEQGDGGITSDHTTSTSAAAMRRWDAIDSDPEFFKRTTKAGNDEFDYTGNATPDDPEDDCEDFSSGGSFTDHSYGVKDNSVKVYEDLRLADLIYNDNNMLYGDEAFYDKAFGVFSSSYRGTS